MPALCGSCGKRMDVPLPSFRVTKKACSVCGGYDPGLKANYSVEAMQIPGSSDDPNKQAEMEERTSG